MPDKDRSNFDANFRSEQDSGSKEFFLGAMIGGVIGAATALFLTPKSGKELRGNLNEQAVLLKDKTGQIRDTANALASAAKDKTAQLRENAMTKGSELASTAKTKTETLTQTLTQQSADLLNKVKGIKTGQQEEQKLKETVLETPSGTIIIDAPASRPSRSVIDIQQKLEETKQAFDETERKLNQ